MVVVATSPSPIRRPAPNRTCSRRSRNFASASRSAHDSAPSTPSASARSTTVGMPLSMQVTSTPAIVSVTDPVGKSAPQVEPAVSAKSIRIGAALPGTPEITVDPRYTGRPSRTGKTAVATEPVFIMLTRTSAVSPTTARRPRSTAKGPTPASRFPQFWRSLTDGSSTPSCRNK